MDLITDGGTKIPHAAGCGQQQRREKRAGGKGKVNPPDPSIQD